MAADNDIGVLAVAVADLDPEFVAEVREIAAARGRPLSFCELRSLADAAERMWSAAEGRGGADPGRQTDILPRQARAGNAVLFSPTIAAKMMLERVTEWAEADARSARSAAAGEAVQRRLDRATAYILAHACDEPGLRAIAVRSEAWQAVDDWALSLTCSEADLDAAIRDLAGGELPPAADSAEKKSPAAPTGPNSSGSSSSTPAAPPGTGSMTSPNSMPSGFWTASPANSAGAAAPTLPPPAPASPPIPTTRASPPLPPTAGCATGSEPPPLPR